jgi:outer membrane protein OmpA-like peptidoglycan-associated protein
LKDISINDLNRIVKMLSDNKSINIEIHGHTDNIGSDSANMILSSERAKAVKNYIIKKGILASRLKTIPFGEKVPVADNNTEEGRKSNRRVEFKIVEGIGKR